MSTKPIPANFPLPITVALERLEQVLECPDLVFGGARSRQMRSERKEAIKAVLRILLTHGCLLYDVVAVQLYQEQGKTCAVPITFSWMAKIARMPIARIKRAWYSLKAAGLVESAKQITRTEEGKPGILVSATLKKVSFKFWEYLRLGNVLRRSLNYAQKKGSIFLKANVFRKIGKKVVYAIGSGIVSGKNDSKQQREHSRKLSDQLVVLDCLYKKYGGTGCQSPTCSRRLREICMKLRQ